MGHTVHYGVQTKLQRWQKVVFCRLYVKQEGYKKDRYTVGMQFAERPELQRPFDNNIGCEYFICCKMFFRIAAWSLLCLLQCIPILLYGTDVCPMNSADRRSLQFTINKIVYKIFGDMSKDLYIETSAHFGIESVENLIADRRNRFINRYGETDNYLCMSSFM